MSPSTARQRLAIYLATLTTLIALAAGALLRSNLESASYLFTDSRTGISTRYPVGWLLEAGTSSSDFVMRVQDPASLPFKTTLSISVLNTGPDATIADIADLLSIRRASQLSSYKTLEVAPTTVGGRTATQITYAYATTDTNPSLQSLPVIVRGVDVLLSVRGQTYIITFLSDAQNFDRNRRYFDLFLRRLELKS